MNDQTFSYPIPSSVRVRCFNAHIHEMDLHAASVERANRRSTARRWIQTDRRAKQTEVFVWDGLQQLNQNVVDLALHIVG